MVHMGEMSALRVSQNAAYTLAALVALLTNTRRYDGYAVEKKSKRLLSPEVSGTARSGSSLEAKVHRVGEGRVYAVDVEWGWILPLGLAPSRKPPGAPRATQQRPATVVQK